MLRTFLRDRRASAAVEFAFIAPVMLALYVGMADLTQGLLAQRKVSHVATVVGDILSQKQSWKGSDIDDLFQVGKALMTPMPSGDLGIRVSSIAIDENKVARVQWSQANNLGGLTAQSKDAIVTDAVPQEMRIAGTALVQADTSYTFKSPLAEALPKEIIFKRTTYLKPRYDVPVGHTD